MVAEKSKKSKEKKGGAKKKQPVDPKKTKSTRAKTASKTVKATKKTVTKTKKKPSAEKKERIRKHDKTPQTLAEKMESAEAWIKRKMCKEDDCPHEKCIHHKFLHRCLMPLYISHKIIPQASLLPWVEIFNQHKHGILEGDADMKILIGFDDGKTRYDFALVELKTEAGRLSSSQKEFLGEQILTKRVMVAVCHGLTDAKMFLDAYMKRKADGTNFYTAEQMKKFCFAGTTTEGSILSVFPAKKVEGVLGMPRGQRTMSYYTKKNKKTAEK